MTPPKPKPISRGARERMTLRKVKCAVCGKVHSFAEKAHSSNPHFFKYPQRIRRFGSVEG